MKRFTVRLYSDFGMVPQDQTRILFESDDFYAVKIFIKDYFSSEDYFNAVYFVDNELNKSGYVGRDLTINCGEDLATFCEIDKEYTFDAGDGKTTMKVKPVNLSNYVWVEKFVYIKCPHCGKVAAVNVMEVLTSLPPQYGWECKHCGAHGYMFTSDLYKEYEQVNPSKEDKDLYDPPITWSQESISINSDGEVLAHDESTITWSPNESTEGAIYLGSGELKVYSHCEICGAVIESPAISIGFSEPPRHICEDCAEKIRKLIGK